MMKHLRFCCVLALCLLLCAGSALAQEAPRGLERSGATGAPAATEAPGATPAPDRFGRGAADPVPAITADPTQGMRVVVPGDEHYILDIVQVDGQFLVLVEEAVVRNADGTFQMDDDEVAEARLAEGFELPEGMDMGIRVWREFSPEEGVGRYTDVLPYMPSLWTVDDPDWLVYEEDGFFYDLNSFPWQATWNGALARSGDSENSQETCGLWLVEAGKEPILAHTGTYFNPMVIPGEDRVIAGKFRSGEGVVYTIVVSVDLNTFEEEHLMQVFPHSIAPVCYLDGSLVVRIVEQDNPDSYAYALCDLSDFSFEQIDTALGDAIASVRQRPLQSTGTPGEYYTTVPDYIPGATSIGTYNVHTLEHWPLKALKNQLLDPAATWVDAERGLIYSCIDGDLVAIPYN